MFDANVAKGGGQGRAGNGRGGGGAGIHWVTGGNGCSVCPGDGEKDGLGGCHF